MLTFFLFWSIKESVKMICSKYYQYYEWYYSKTVLPHRNCLALNISCRNVISAGGYVTKCKEAVPTGTNRHLVPTMWHKQVHTRTHTHTHTHTHTQAHTRTHTHTHTRTHTHTHTHTHISVILITFKGTCWQQKCSHKPTAQITDESYRIS